MSNNIVLLVASTDDHFRETVRESLVNIPSGKIVAEYQEVAQNLYIRVLQDLERHPHAALIMDLAGDAEVGLKALEKVKQAAPDLYVIVSNYHADGETVIGALRSGANDFLMQPLKRTEFRDAITRLERAPRRAATGESKLGKVYTFVGPQAVVATTSLAVNFAAVLAQRKPNTVLFALDSTPTSAAIQLPPSPHSPLPH